MATMTLTELAAHSLRCIDSTAKTCVMSSSARSCWDDGAQALAVGKEEAARRWFQRAITYTHGIYSQEYKAACA